MNVSSFGVNRSSSGGENRAGIRTFNLDLLRRKFRRLLHSFAFVGPRLSCRWQHPDSAEGCTPLR